MSSRRGGGNNVEGKVYVGGLPEDATSEELDDVFHKFGRIRKIWVARRPPGFAFVEFEDTRDAEDAVRSLDGTRICGVKARVELSTGRSRRDRDDRGGGGGGYRSGGGGGGGYRGGGGNRDYSRFLFEKWPNLEDHKNAKLQSSKVIRLFQKILHSIVSSKRPPPFFLHCSSSSSSHLVRVLARRTSVAEEEEEAVLARVPVEEWGVIYNFPKKL
ncbi:hypothetical protein niasHT_021147 [Heterodera trifolii]|uniref:RRM domain-containing protein n=1 Tax=Heterodera trifolii TaxID=157864 RepID=A0ABD2JEZ7_9BILA